MRARRIGSRALVRMAGLVLIALAFLVGCGNRDRGPATADANTADATTADATTADATTADAKDVTTQDPAAGLASRETSTVKAEAPALPPATARHQATSIPAAAAVDGAAESPARAQLSNAASSVDELMTRVLEALAHADPAALDALRLTEEEHREILWPADPGQASGAPLDLAWDLLDRRSRSGVHKAIAEFGGRTLTFTGVEFERGTELRGSYALHRGPVLYTRDSSRGESLELRFLGSVIERDGRWKLVSFRD